MYHSLLFWGVHYIEAQRTKYIELKTANPSLRLRSEEQLGPRTKVTVNHQSSSSLQKPESAFVELSVFKRDFPDRVVDASEIVYETIDGQTIAGAIWHTF